MQIAYFVFVNLMVVTTFAKRAYLAAQQKDRRIARNYSTCFPYAQSPIGQQAASFD